MNLKIPDKVRSIKYLNIISKVYYKQCFLLSCSKFTSESTSKSLIQYPIFQSFILFISQGYMVNLITVIYDDSVQTYKTIALNYMNFHLDLFDFLKSCLKIIILSYNSECPLLPLISFWRSQNWDDIPWNRRRNIFPLIQI